MSDFKIDYVIISNNDNQDYRGLKHPITKRWNDLGIKVVYVDVVDDYDKLINLNPSESPKGNIYIPLVLDYRDYPWWLWRYFGITIARFVVATEDFFKDKTIIISDGDLFPINKKYIYCPSYKLKGNIQYYIDNGALITTNHYPNGNALATYTYGKGNTFKKVLDIFTPTDTLGEKLYRCIKHASIIAKNKLYKMYMMEEDYLNYMYAEYKYHIKVKNRKWLEQVQEMNNLYDYQIEYLETPFDLCPFIEFHNMRASTMTQNMWDKLFKLLEEFDKYPITPNNWYYETIDNPWRDTIITKTGELILGCEYDK